MDSDDSDTSDSAAEFVEPEKMHTILEQIKSSAVGANRDTVHSTIPVALRSNSDVVSFTPHLHRYTKTLQLQLDAEQNKSIVPSVWELYTHAHRQKQIKGGLYRMKKLREKLVQQDERHQRSKQQIQFHEAFLCASAKHIYGDDLSANYLDILAENNWNDIAQEVLVCCPRRFGKTYATCLYVAAYAMTIPSHTISVFSPSKRQSQDFLDLVKRFIREDPEGRHMILRENVNQIWLKGADENDVRKIKCYPAAVRTLKGVGGELIICEEAAAMPIAVFYEVIVPLLEMDTTACICISTILGNDNFYTKLLNLKDHLGEPFFVSFVFTLLCDACKAADKDPSECAHLLDSLPRWQSQGKHKRIRAMMNSLGQQQLLAQETMGLITGADNSAFNFKSIQHLFDTVTNPRGKIDPLNRHVFYSIDPNGGGHSKFAIVSCVYDGDKMTILGAEAVTASTPEHYEKVLLDHVKTVQKLLPEHISVFIIESNLGFESAHIYRCIKNSGLKLCVALRDEKGGIGVLTTHATKEACVDRLNECLNQKTVKIYEKFVNIQASHHHRDKSTVDSTLGELQKQLENYKMITDYDRDKPFKKTKITFSGKADGDDDLCIALQLNLYWMKLYFRDDRYSAFW